MRKRFRLLNWLALIAILLLLLLFFAQLGVKTIGVALDGGSSAADIEPPETMQPADMQTYPPEFMEDGIYDPPEDEIIYSDAQDDGFAESPVDKTVDQLIDEAQAEAQTTK